MSKPKIEWMNPGEDPTVIPFEAPRPRISGCLRTIGLVVAFIALIIFVIGLVSTGEGAGRRSQSASLSAICHSTTGACLRMSFTSGVHGVIWHPQCLLTLC